MSKNIVYVMGPSGSGKDSLMKWVMLHKNDALCLRWAQRLVTRDNRSIEMQEGTDRFVSEDEFDALLAQDMLAMYWRAHEFSYGIEFTQLLPTTEGELVLINGSRAYYPQAKSLFPELTAIHVTASPAILEQRLLARAREPVEAISKRLQRAELFKPQENDALLEIQNHFELEQSGLVILEYLNKLKI